MIWLANEVKDGEQYRLHLCQATNGVRYFDLAEVGSGSDFNRTSSVVFGTQIIPNELLRRSNFSRIAEAVVLENGETFVFDAHLTWFTEAEDRQIDAGLGWDRIQWATKTPPQLAPK